MNRDDEIEDADWEELMDEGEEDGLDLDPSLESVAFATTSHHSTITMDPETQIIAQEIEQDPLVALISSAGTDSPEMFSQLLLEMARSGAGMEADRRREVEPLRRTAISGKRVATLKSMGDLMFKQKSMETSAIDMNSPAFRNLFVLLVETFILLMRDVSVSPEQERTIINRLQMKLSEEEWVKEARARMKG